MRGRSAETNGGWGRNHRSRKCSHRMCATHFHTAPLMSIYAPTAYPTFVLYPLESISKSLILCLELKIAFQFSILRVFTSSQRAERKWRLKLTAMCGLTAISCSIIYIIIKFVFHLYAVHADCIKTVRKRVSTWSINCLLHVWRSCVRWNTSSDREPTYVLVLEEAQHFQLPKYTLRRDEWLKHVGKLLQSHSASIARICHRPRMRRQKEMQISFVH